MAKTLNRRVTAQIDGDFVVFLIGMRFNKPWKLWKWGSVVAAMPRMLAELARKPELGLLHARTWVSPPNIMVVQYWRSFEALESYARSRDGAHLPAWQAFHKTVGTSGDVGIWHETYVVRAGAHESLYANMPAFGLGRAGRIVDAVGPRQAARGRMTAEA